MRQIPSKVDLETLRVQIKNTRTTKAGAILLEVEAEEDADRLAVNIDTAVSKTVQITRPSRLTPVLLLDVPEWADVDVIANELSRTGIIAVYESPKVVIRENGDESLGLTSPWHTPSSSPKTNTSTSDGRNAE